MNKLQNDRVDDIVFLLKDAEKLLEKA